MVRDNFCASCSWWVFTYADGVKKFGTCENIFTQERIRVSQDYDTTVQDDPTIFTDSTFGCNFHLNQEHENIVTLIQLPKK